MGRFMTPDWAATPVPIPYAKPALPQSLNLYGYVANNPITGIDPDGHQDPKSAPAGDKPVQTTKECDAATGASCTTEEEDTYDTQRSGNQITLYVKHVTTTTDANGKVISTNETITNAIYNVQKDGTIGFSRALQGEPGDQHSVTQNDAEKALGGASRVYDQIADKIRTDGLLRYVGTVVAAIPSAAHFVHEVAEKSFLKAAGTTIEHFSIEHVIDEGALVEK